MEKRKDLISSLKLCRFCLCQNESLTSLYERSRTPKNAVPLPLKILSFTSIEVFPSDKMPSFICSRCKFFMDMCYEYKQICRQADETILQYIQNGSTLETVPWPSQLIKVLPKFSKSPSKEVMKTVVEGGATVQVTSQDASDSDEDDGNVFNIKIDRSDNGSKDPMSTTFKVVTSEKVESGLEEEKPSHDNKEFSSVSKLTRHVRSHANERGYPCKYCDKSFMKSHHYTRHLRVKHREAVRSTRGPFGQMERFRCEQCEDTFDTQDDLIYHSAIHATQNLTCPLCQEKFDNVDAVTAHIKSHVNGIEFMCDLCELVFTSRAKLESHVAVAHDEEFHNDVQLDESSMELDAENEDDNDSAINVKEEDDHMVVEVKKTDDFIINDNAPETEEKANTNSEESEAETYADLSSVSTPAPAAIDRAGDNQTASILRKAEEIKRKVQQKATESKKEKNKPSTNSAGASDKSLRLLEKELQELQRTNTRNEVKSTPKAVDSLRTRRPQLHTSTPKTRAIEEKRTQMLAKSSAEKKLPERRVVTKENKEPKETKEVKTNNTSAKEEKESKDKDTPKSAVKNGGADKSSASADESIRRSTRPSKVKDYAKMIRDKTESEEEESDMDDEEYDAEVEESRARARRGAARARAPGRKRGRPRKDVLKEVPNKLKKEDPAENEEERSDKEDEEEKPKPAAESEKKDASKEQIQESKVDTNKADSDAEPKPSSGVLVSPTGQTLKKVPVRALPPGVKPLPLPINARPMGSGELCEMQIGKKVVKVQKIIMTKAEVEAMAKKGLVEMKDGTMVLKQGIKLPTSDALAIKSSLVGDKDVSKNYTAKKDKAQAQE